LSLNLHAPAWQVPLTPQDVPLLLFATPQFPVVASHFASLQVPLGAGQSASMAQQADMSLSHVLLMQLSTEQDSSSAQSDCCVQHPAMTSTTQVLPEPHVPVVHGLLSAHSVSDVQQSSITSNWQLPFTHVSVVHKSSSLHSESSVQQLLS